MENNWAGDLSQADTEPDQDPVVFRARRAQAFQAMYENLPLRHDQMPSGPDVRLHRRLPYGRLADFTMLDTRQYRSDQPCGDGDSSTCDDRFDPDNTMLGGKQRKWLLDGFRQSRARWQVLGNQAPMGQTDWTPGPETHVWLDPWDGYVAERNQVLGGGAGQRSPQPGGDHRRPAPELRAGTEARLRQPGLTRRSARSSSVRRSPAAATAPT